MLPLKNVLLVAVARMQEEGKTRVAQTECCVIIYTGSGEKAREKKTA